MKTICQKVKVQVFGGELVDSSPRKKFGLF